MREDLKSWRSTRVSEVVPTPWKNGGGLTRELLAWPDPHDWRVRVSVAVIDASGPFSVFPGIDRWFAVLDGDGVVLAMDGGRRERLDAGAAESLQFRGDEAVQCELLGKSTTDFNLMVRRGGIAVRVTPFARAPRLQTRAGSVGCFAAGRTTLHDPQAGALELDGPAFAWLEDAGHRLLALQAVGALPRGWWIEVDPAGLTESAAPVGPWRVAQ